MKRSPDIAWESFSLGHSRLAVWSELWELCLLVSWREQSRRAMRIPLVGHVQALLQTGPVAVESVQQGHSWAANCLTDGDHPRLETEAMSLGADWLKRLALTDPQDFDDVKSQDDLV